jgi:hypothetical protein
MRKKRPRSITSADQAPIVFDDVRVRELAKIAQLPQGADMAAFAAGIREAARIYARDARSPNVNALHDEIEQLHKAAECQRYEVVADLLERLSPRARDMLSGHGAQPPSGALRDPALREEACAVVAQLCQYGGRWVKGPPSKGSRPKWRPHLYAPDKDRNPPKRDAERHFVLMLQLAWLDATGVRPTVTARHRDESRDLGPFARFARECLRLFGATDADVVELMHELDRHRDKAK